MYCDLSAILCDFFAGGSDDDAKSRERIERLQYPVLKIAGDAFAQELRARNRGMFQKRNREFADPEIPVGMAGPFDIEIVAIVERSLDLSAHQLIDDDAIVDAMDRAVFEVELPAALFDLRDARPCGCRSAFR